MKAKTVSETLSRGGDPFDTMGSGVKVLFSRWRYGDEMPYEEDAEEYGLEWLQFEVDEDADWDGQNWQNLSQFYIWLMGPVEAIKKFCVDWDCDLSDETENKIMDVDDFKPNKKPGDRTFFDETGGRY